MSIGAIVGRSMTELGWVGPLAEARLLGHWASVVGPEIASRCQPVSLVDGELKISAESTAWATQLRLMAPQLLARICREMPTGTVRRLGDQRPVRPVLEARAVVDAGRPRGARHLWLTGSLSTSVLHSSSHRSYPDSPGAQKSLCDAHSGAASTFLAG